DDVPTVPLTRGPGTGARRTPDRASGGARRRPLLARRAPRPRTADRARGLPPTSRCASPACRGCRPPRGALPHRMPRHRPGERRGVAFLPREVDDVNPVDELRKSLGDRPVEAPDRLRSAEDQEQSLARTDLEPLPGGLAIDVGEIAYRCAGEITGMTAGQCR